jgi:hypothetical protein
LIPVREVHGGKLLVAEALRPGQSGGTSVTIITDTAAPAPGPRRGPRDRTDVMGDEATGLADAEAGGAG